MNSLVLHSSIVLYYAIAWPGLLPLILEPAKNIQEDERITTMRSIGSRFLTIWNFTFQTVVFVGYLICDILEVQQKYTPFRRKFKRFLDEFFYCFVAPTSIFVFFLFWAFYLFDPGLVYIYPTLIGDLLSPWVNHTLHTNILPIALLQVYHNKVSPVNRAAAQKRYLILILLYLVCLYGTYFQMNVWVYPFLDYLFEPLRLLSLALLVALGFGINTVFYRLNELYCNSSFGST